ncbi:MAG TPA: hypothetical protein VFG47_12965 [Geminicoccaceae bacterium]|nr:hypothetical protein [Geminicoccaceae bacterium]
MARSAVAAVRGALLGIALAIVGVALGGCAAGVATATRSAAAPSATEATTGGHGADALLAAGGAASLGLIGLSGEEAQRLLGPPGVLRREQLAEFWRYRLEPCVLDLYLYQGEAAEQQRVRYAELRRNRRPARRDDCRGPLLEINARRI